MSEILTTDTVPPWTLGWRLQRALAWANLTTDDMAKELDVSRATISRWCNDRGAPPRTGFLKLWALRTGVALDWLRHGTAPSSDQRIRPFGWMAKTACPEAA